MSGEKVGGGAVRRTREADQEATGKRGRPRKFGRPSQVVALTLPEDVIERLGSMNPDLAWAIVGLVERASPGRAGPQAHEAESPPAELVHLPGSRALIVVQPDVFAGLRGVSTIPLAEGRAFLAFEGRGGIADLEVAILDRIDELPPRSDQRRQLGVVRDLVREWRRESGLVFRTPHIIVAEGRARGERKPLPGPEGARRRQGNLRD